MPRKQKFEPGDIVGSTHDCEICKNTRFVVLGRQKDGSGWMLSNINTPEVPADGGAGFDEDCLFVDESLTAVHRAKLKAAQPKRSRRRSTGCLG